MNHFVVHLKLTQYCKSIILQLKKKKGGAAAIGNNRDEYHDLNKVKETRHT